jgi:hypothetical protein
MAADAARKKVARCETSGKVNNKSPALKMRKDIAGTNNQI